MKQYIKDGVTKYASEIVITKDGMTTTNPTEAMILADGWVEYTEPEPTPAPEPTEEEKLAIAKRDKKRNAKYYGGTPVDGFYIGETRLWLPLEKRTGLKLRFEAEKASGKTETTLWDNGVQYPLNIETAIQMLYALEVYASMCYDQTQAHLAAIDALTTVEEVEAYDHTSGYPEKLKF
jgi:hypothetical protein